MILFHSVRAKVLSNLYLSSFVVIGDYRIIKDITGATGSRS